MDTVRVHVVVKDEMFPRSYVMSGGTFAAMKDAVKALGGRFDGSRSSWLLPGSEAWSMLKALREQYTVTEMALVRIQRERGDHGSICMADRALDKRPCLTELWLEAARGDGTWLGLPPLPVKIDIAPELEAEAAAALAADGLTPAQIHRLSIGRRVAYGVLEKMAADADDRVKALLKGKPRTKENYQAAIGELLKELGWEG